MANKKYVNNEKDGWNQECEEDFAVLYFRIRLLVV